MNTVAVFSNGWIPILLHLLKFLSMKNSTACSVSFISANGVTLPCFTPRYFSRRSSDAKLRFPAPSCLPSVFKSTFVFSSAVIRKCLFPLESLRNKFLHKVPFSGSPSRSISSIVCTGSCSTTSYLIPILFNASYTRCFWSSMLFLLSNSGNVLRYSQSPFPFLCSYTRNHQKHYTKPHRRLSIHIPGL